MKKENKSKYKPYTIIVIVLLVLMCSIVMFYPDVSSKPAIEKNSVLLLNYSGIPLIFWILLGVGLALGLTLHGFHLFSINIRKSKK